MSTRSQALDRRAPDDLDDRPLGPVFDTAFRARGLPVHLLVVRGTPELLEEGQARVIELLDLWLRRTGELNRLARAAGEPVTVAPETLLLADVAGRLDAAEGEAPAGPASWTLRTADEVTVTLPAVPLAALTSLAPALAADLVVRELVDGGALGACARIGDDAAMLGVPPRLDGWRVEVPDGYGRTRQLLLTEGGVSSRGRWTGARASTVTAPTAWQAARRASRDARSPDPAATPRARQVTSSTS